MGITDKILKFYRENDHLSPNKPKFPQAEGFLSTSNGASFINSNPGIGDILSVLHLPKLLKGRPNFQVCSQQPELFDKIAKYNKDVDLPNVIQGELFRVELLQDYNLGGGHFFQNIQKALGLDIDYKPKADLEVPGVKRQKDKVVINFHAGFDQIRQREEVHPRARELYPEHKETIQKFIDNNKNRYHFVEVSAGSSYFNNVEDKCGMDIDGSIEEIASCEYYLGIINGIMHIATALDLKCITIINFPSAKQLYLPRLKNYDLPDLDWLYPQNVHLHEDDDGELVKYLSYDNLEKAFAGDVYPFWKKDWMDYRDIWVF